MSVSKAVQNITKAPKGVSDFCVATTVTDDLLHVLKKICRNDKNATDDVSRCLLLDLASRSAIVRMRSLNVIDSLFLRSKEFRKGISVNIRSIAECAGFLGGKPLDNMEHRDLLQHRVKEMLEMWDMYYGDFLPEIRALARHMKEFLHLVMPDIKTRALQHATELDKKQRIIENKVLAKGHQVLAELISDGVQSLSIQEIRSSLSELNSCFNILFPGVTDFGSSSRYQSDKNMTLNRYESISSSSSFIAPATSLLWECDGQEVDDQEYSNAVSDVDDEKDNADVDDDDNDDDVAWEDAEEGKKADTIGHDDDNNNNNNDDDDDDDDDDGSIDVRRSEMNMTPFTLEIRLPMTASVIETSDNEIVMHTLKEITNHLTIHALPVLRGWREALSAALGCYNHTSDSLSNGMISSNKRKFDSDSVVIANNTITSNNNMNQQNKMKITAALHEVCAVDDEVQKILRTRCKTLLVPKDTHLNSFLLTG